MSINCDLDGYGDPLTWTVWIRTNGQWTADRSFSTYAQAFDRARNLKAFDKRTSILPYGETLPSMQAVP